MSTDAANPETIPYKEKGFGLLSGPGSRIRSSRQARGRGTAASHSDLGQHDGSLMNDAGQTVSSCLVLLLETQLKIFVTPDCPATRLSLAHRVLAEETTGDTNGFYDVLRSRDGRVIGIRYTVGAGFDSLLNAVSKLPYAQVNGRQQSMELFFSRERQYDPHKSTDQLFGDDRVFRSGSLYAMTFGLGDLPEVDRLYLLRIAASNLDAC
jgi:hypothetical protein